MRIDPRQYAHCMDALRSLLALSSAGGCGCKLGPSSLAEILSALEGTPESSDVLLGLHAADDAAVIRLSDSVAAVLTVDFFTPIVDSAYDWGAIAAANALSDVYAVGGSPRAALNILAWPDRSDLSATLNGVLAGARDKLTEAGAELLGGHSIRDPVPKFGMAVLGTVDPNSILRTSAGAPGDVLVLTKPIGTGALTTAARAGMAPPGSIASGVEWMRRLNDRALLCARAHGVRAATDVTGFGLGGHALDLAIASGVSVELFMGAIPTLPGFREVVDKGIRTTITAENSVTVIKYLQTESITDYERSLLADPQTSGGLLLAVAPGQVASLVRALVAEGLEGAIVGRLADGQPGALALLDRLI